MSKNNPLFSVGSAESIDAETGESTPIEGGGFRMLPGPPGTCTWCHVEHENDQPHNRDSLPYQIKFQTIHGRWPTWSDAMAHCTPDVQAAWKKLLIEKLRHYNLEIPPDLA